MSPSGGGGEVWAEDGEMEVRAIGQPPATELAEVEGDEEDSSAKEEDVDPSDPLRSLVDEEEEEDAVVVAS